MLSNPITGDTLINFGADANGDLILLIGAFTPFHEAARATMVRRWPPSYVQNLVEQQGGSFPPHYVARLDRPDMRLLLREPALTPDRERRRATSPGGQRER